MQNLQQKTILKLNKILDYSFKDISLLKLSLTHKSVSGKNNERLEFLGDSILNYTISSEIYDKFDKLDEGALTRIRSNLVSRKSLADISIQFNLGEDIILSASEKAAGGFQRTSILANVLESIFAAVYLDSDINTAKNVILKLYQDKLTEVAKSGGVAKDAKTRLQEWLQAKNNSVPEYSVISITGKAHKQTFTVECSVPFLKLTLQASGSSRRKAEQLVAEEVLAKVEKEHQDKTSK